MIPRRVFIRSGAGVVAVALLSLAAAVFLSPAPASAETFNLSAALDGAQVVPPVATSGTGTASLTYNDATNLLSWTLTFSGLSSDADVAHFHYPGDKGASAAAHEVIFTDAQVVGTGGSVSGSITVIQATEADLLNGMWYMQIHTENNAGGEIRGQVRVQGVGGLADAPDLRAAGLEADASSGPSAGLIAAIAAASAAALVGVVGAARLVGRRARR